MKKVIPFTKTITFKTMIAEVTDIEVTHDLTLKTENEVSGNILVDGRYKMTDASQIEEEFHYKLPFVIDIDSKYTLDNLEITISDFYFEIINEENLKINVEIDMDGIEEKKIIENTTDSVPEVLETDLVREDSEVIPVPVEVDNKTQKLEVLDEQTKETDDNLLIKLEKEINDDLKDEVNANNISSMPKQQSVISPTSVGSIFSSIAANEETFSTYYVYFVRENDTLEFILDKYKVTRELLQSYNDISDIKVGTKLIIPCTTNE